MVKDYVVFDLETTGLSPDKDTIIEIGALKVIQGKVADRFSEFINPHQKLTQQISELTGITDDMLAGARNLQVVVGDFVDFCEDYVVVGHNLGFDYRFTKMAAEKYHLPFEHEGIDTLKIANVTVEGPSKTVSGGRYSNPLIKFGKTARLEMQDALGHIDAIDRLCGGIAERSGATNGDCIGLHVGEDFELLFTISQIFVMSE